MRVVSVRIHEHNLLDTCIMSGIDTDYVKFELILHMSNHVPWRMQTAGFQSNWKPYTNLFDIYDQHSLNQAFFAPRINMSSCCLDKLSK